MDIMRIINNMPELWYIAYNCKVCERFTKQEEWAIDKKVCSKCINKVKTDYEKEAKGKYTFEEYVDALIVANGLTRD